MDPNPTPFPRKRRPVWISTAKKDGDGTKPLKKPAGTAAAPVRPRRAFGVARNTNINPVVEKPPPAIKASKPWKPSGARKDALQAGPTTKNVASPDNASGGRRSVGFEEPVATMSGRIKPSMEAKGAQTPNPLIKVPPTPGTLYLSATPSTPYLSAYNCSKCRLDKLEMSSYWLMQIKLAESVGKHFVTAAFFRLALECGAQPLASLQSELKSYVTRHHGAAISVETTTWDGLCLDYGLSDGQSKITDRCNCDNADPSLLEALDEAADETIKEEDIAEYVGTNSQQKDLQVEEPQAGHTTVNTNSGSKDNNFAEPNEVLGTIELDEAKAMPLPFLVDSSGCILVGTPHGSDKKKSPMAMGCDSGKKLNIVDPGLFEVLDEPAIKVEKTLECDVTVSQDKDFQAEELSTEHPTETINSDPKDRGLAEQKDDLGTKGSDEGKTMTPSFSEDPSGDVSVESPHERGKKKPPIRSVSGKKLNLKKPDRVSSIFPECDATHTQHGDLQAEEPLTENNADDMNSNPSDCNLSEPKDDSGTKELDEAKQMPLPSPASSSGSIPVGVPHLRDKKKSSNTSLSEKKLNTNKTKRVSIVSETELASSKTIGGSRSGHAGNSVKFGEASRGTRPGSKLSGGKLIRKNGAGVRSSLSTKQRTKDEDSEVTKPQISENLSSGEVREDAISY